jgi:hypothetical protein
MARLWKKLEHQGKTTVDNWQQVNVVTNDEEIEVEQRIIIYSPLKVNPKPIPIFENKFVVMDDMFHMIGFLKM